MVQNPAGGRFHQIHLIDERYGWSFTSKAKILTICNGKLMDGRNGTLVIFRFTLPTLGDVPGPRIASAVIQVGFSGFRGQEIDDPEVVAISPAKPQELNITRVSSVSELASATIDTGGSTKPEFEGALNLSQTKKKDYYATVIPKQWNSRGYSSDNSATWRLEEHHSEKNGVPSFLQTAVILQKESDDMLWIKIDIQATVNMNTWENGKETSARFVGRGPIESIDPVEFDRKSFGQRDQGILELTEKTRSSTIALDALDLSKYVGIGLTDEQGGEINEIQEEEQQRQQEAEKGWIIEAEQAEELKGPEAEGQTISSGKISDERTTSQNKHDQKRNGKIKNITIRISRPVDL